MYWIVKKIQEKIKICIYTIKYSILNRYNKERQKEMLFKRMSFELKKFIEINKKHWIDIKGDENKGYILVEGYLAEYGPNYLLRTGIIAKAIEDKTNCIPIIILDKPKYLSDSVTELYRSFNINRFLYISQPISNLFYCIKAIVLTLQCCVKCETGEKLLKLKYGKFMIGDLIYDEIIKNCCNLYTIGKMDKKYFIYIYRAYMYSLIYQKVFTRYNIKYIVVTHTAYTAYGLLARIGLQYNAKIFETTDMNLTFFEKKQLFESIPCYHNGIRNLIEKTMPIVKKNFNVSEIVIDDLKKRFEGSIEQIDVQLAFKDKAVYDKDQLKELLGIVNDFPCVCIFAHVFSDAPHCSESTLFQDYYLWLVETLACIVDIKTINWIIKSHPSAKLYGEDNAIAEMIRSCKSNHIFLLPSECSTSSIVNIADVILTVQGTVGIEFSCLGIPVVITGKAFYSGFGFTIEPTSKEEYFKCLRNIAKINRLSNIQISVAKEVYLCYKMISLLNSNLISMNALNSVWGYNVAGRDINVAMSEINANLNIFDPKEEILFQQVKKILE